MKTWLKILLLFVLPALALISYPPDVVIGGWFIILLVIALVVFLGIRIIRGDSLALTFSIFLQGMNVIIRMMMFFNNTLPKNGTFNLVYMIMSLIGFLISFYLVTRLDRVDVRSLLRT